MSRNPLADQLSETERHWFAHKRQMIKIMYGFAPVEGEKTPTARQAQKRKSDIKREIEELLLKGDTHSAFRLFLRTLEPLIPDWVDPGEITDDIVRALTDGDPNILLAATRNSAKSTITAAFVAFSLWRNPLLQVLVLSKSSPLAKRMLRTVRHFIENNPLLMHMAADKHCLKSTEQYQTVQNKQSGRQNPSLTCYGISAAITGMRSDLIIADDVEQADTNSPEKAEELLERLFELSNICNPDAKQIVLGTYSSHYSVYAMLPRYGWKVHKALMPEVDASGKILGSRWPARFTIEDLKKKRRSMSANNWALHWLLAINPDKMLSKPLKIRDFIVISDDPIPFVGPVSAKRSHIPDPDLPTYGAPEGDSWHRAVEVSQRRRIYPVTVAVVDPSRGMAQGDAIGFVILSVTETGMGFLRLAKGVRGDNLRDCLAEIATDIRTYQATKLLVEATVDGAFAEILNRALRDRQYPITAETIPLKAGQGKGHRMISNISPLLSDGRLMIAESVIRGEHGADFVNQLVNVTWDARKNRANDDIVDALSWACAAVKDNLTEDTESVGMVGGYDIEYLRNLPLRQGGLPSDYLDAILAEDETEQSLRAEKDHLLRLQYEDLRYGKGPDPYVAKRVASIDATLAQLGAVRLI